MSKTIKILGIIIFTMILIVSMSTICMASYSEIVGQLTDGEGTVDTGGILGVGTNIVSIITTIGIIVAVVVLLVLGIKYMMGSAAEKAEYKKTMIPYLIGAVLIFGASAIAKAVIAMSETITAG